MLSLGNVGENNMQIVHKNCGGEIIVGAKKYQSEEYGTVDSYWCLKCRDEIIGDSQIQFIPENELDKIQIEGIRK